MKATHSVTVNVDGNAAPPKMDVTGFDLQAISPGETAPATYRLQADVAGATHCVLCVGDSRPMEIIEDPTHIERLITFDQLGSYTVRLAAVNGKLVVEKSKGIHVGAGERGGLLAKLKVSYEAVRVGRFTRTVHIHVGWQADLQDPISPFRKERSIEQGCTLTDLALLNQSDPRAPQKLDCQPSPDKTKIVLTGELVRPNGIFDAQADRPFLAGGGEGDDGAPLAAAAGQSG